MRRVPTAATLAAVACAVVLGALAPCAASAAAPSFEAGAARVVTSPPPYSAAASDALYGATCPAAVFTGPRQWLQEEPYIDTDGSGSFNYGPSPAFAPEPYCDANLNGRWDGLYSSGGVDHRIRDVHDPIDARAIAISHGGGTLVVVSVVAQGLFENYIARMRAKAQQMRPGITGMIVSANHNESSPDTIGIYGGPDPGTGAFGLFSGIDDFYMDFLVDRVAQAAVDAYDSRQPATVHARQLPLPSSVKVTLSHNFPTTFDDRSPASIDPKIGVLQARDPHGAPIFTLMSLAAHNQEIGHSGVGNLGYEVSSDWPGYFASAITQAGGGMGVFLVGDNGSEEDPETVPPVSTTDHPECSDGCYAQAQATGEALAAAVMAAAPGAKPIHPGPVSLRRSTLFVPIENNLFKAAAVAGLFGERETYLNGVAAGHAGPDLKTSVAVADVGPDLQLIANPGEAFPSLMIGTPFGVEDAGCPGRANPPVPTWHASAKHRFQVGLADDMIGYMIPAWAYSSGPGEFTPLDGCVNDTNDVDPAGHQHKLETEGVGPTAGNAVATASAALLDQHPDPHARIWFGRFIRPDGTLSPNPAGAVGVYLRAKVAGGGRPRILALAGNGRFGALRTYRKAHFIDYDGVQQDGAAGLLTRGMVVHDRGCPVAHRYYVDAYPALLAPAGIGAAAGGRPARSAGC